MILGFAWSRNFYAKYNDIYFCFEHKKDRDYFVHNGAVKVSAAEAYKHKYIQVKASCALGANKERTKKIRIFS